MPLLGRRVSMYAFPECSGQGTVVNTLFISIAAWKSEKMRTGSCDIVSDIVERCDSERLFDFALSSAFLTSGAATHDVCFIKVRENRSQFLLLNLRKFSYFVSPLHSTSTRFPPTSHKGPSRVTFFPQTLASLFLRYSRAAIFPRLSPISSTLSTRSYLTSLPNLAAPTSASGSVTPRKRSFGTSNATMATSSTSSPISIPDKVGDFKLVTKPDLDFAKGVQLAKWESQSTGMKVVWSGVEGQFPSLSVTSAGRGAARTTSEVKRGYRECQAEAGSDEMRSSAFEDFALFPNLERQENNDR